MPKVSIVMPVYNVEPYLAQALESILGQTLEDWELICVNDCSTDDSLSILQRYAKRDSRIRIVENMSNRGAGASRNIGFELSRGEWIMFLDADDYFASNMLEKMYASAIENSVDVVYTNYCVHDMKKHTVVPKEKSLFVRAKVEGQVFSGRDFPDIVFETLPIMPWNKLCRREFLTKGKIYFQEIPNSNDVYWGSMVAVLAPKITFLLDPLVTYRVSHSHQISAKRGKNPMCAYYALKKVKDRMEKDNIYSVFKKSFYWQVLSGMSRALKAEGTDMSVRLDLRRFMRKEGWHLLGMSGLTEKDFFKKYDYERYVTIGFSSDVVYSESMFDALKKITGKVYLWGFGKWGSRFYEAAKYYDYPLYGIIDEGTKLYGERVDGFKILPCNEIEDTFDYVVITNEFYGESVKKRLRETGHDKVKIIDIGFWMFNDVHLSDCIFSV